MDWLLEKLIRHPRLGATAILLAALVSAGFIWWQFVWQNPHKVFEDMLAGSLSTASVTKVARASSGNQSIEQYARLEMGSVNAADWLVVATQGNSSVATESIGTPATGYIRYTNIVTDQKTAKGARYDFGQVLNVWAKSDGKADPSLSHLFSQTLLDISSAPLPPIADLPEAERQELLDYMHSQQIFSPSYGSVKRGTIAGRGVYTYQVSVKLGAYIRMMQAFAHDVGLHDLDTLDASQYSTVQPVAMTLSVDRVSHRLVEASYAGSGFSQRYTDWGLQTPVAVPHATVTTTELQNRLQSLSAGAHV